MTLPNHYHQQGISLIELMISLTLSSLLMLGVMKMFVDSTSNSLADTALAQVQDSGRIAMELLKRDIRMAGFQGGISKFQAPAGNSLIDLSNTDLEEDDTPVEIIEIVEGGDAAASDQLRIRRAFDTGSKITSFYDADQKLLLEPAVCALSSDNVFVATDKQNVASFQFSQPSNCETNNTLGAAFPIGKDNKTVNLQNFALDNQCSTTALENCPSLYRFDSVNGSLYSVQPRKSVDGNNALGSDNQPIMALFLNGTEMVEGVESLQVLYGIEAPNGTVRYKKGCDVTPCTITNTDDEITHIKFSLVVASAFPVSSQNRQQSYSVFNLKTEDSIYQTNDRRLRRVFSSTIQLRNRG